MMAEYYIYPKPMQVLIRYTPSHIYHCYKWHIHPAYLSAWVSNKFQSTICLEIYPCSSEDHNLRSNDWLAPVCAVLWPIQVSCVLHTQAKHQFVRYESTRSLAIKMLLADTGDLFSGPPNPSTGDHSSNRPSYVSTFSPSPPHTGPSPIYIYIRYINATDELQ